MAKNVEYHSVFFFATPPSSLLSMSLRLPAIHDFLVDAVIQCPIRENPPLNVDIAVDAADEDPNVALLSSVSSSSSSTTLNWSGIRQPVSVGEGVLNTKSPESSVIFTRTLST